MADRHPQHRRYRLRRGLQDHGHGICPVRRHGASLGLARSARRAALGRGLRPGNGGEHEPRHRPRLGRLHQARRHHRQRPGAAQRRHVAGPWHVAAQRWPATPAPGCGWTYSAETHPASPAPDGTMPVSWPATTMTLARHATCSPSSPTCPSAHPYPAELGGRIGRPHRAVAVTSLNGRPVNDPRATVTARGVCGTRYPPYARHLDLQDELPERVPNRALCAFVKSVAASPWCARSVMLTCFCLSLLTPLFFLLRQHRDARRPGDDPAVWK